MIPTIIQRIEYMMGYKAIKKIKIKQGYSKINKTRQKITKNNISYKE